MKPNKSKRFWIRAGFTCLVALVALLLVAEIAIRNATPILKGRIEETLGARFDSRVELGNLNVSILQGLQVNGDALRIYPPDPVVAAGATKPLIAIERFRFHSGLFGLFFKPMHVGTVHVTGLVINIPPRELRQESPGAKLNRGKIEINVDEIICESSRLIIGTLKPDKDPKDFELRHIVLHNVGPDAPWKYDAVLTNAIPRGDIKATGTFGPWQNGSPGDSPVTGHYIFSHADLNTIKGIGGILSSVGDFQGRLNRIDVKGTTETPDFSLDSANQPIPLHTRFQAIVDGTTGDTYLEHIDAKLRDSSFTTSGSVVNIKGVGHRIDLDVDIPAARMRDFLDLAVKTKPAIMTAAVTMKAKLQIHPGKEPVPKKLNMQGNFSLADIHFTNPQVEDKVDMFSLRAQGDPKASKPGTEDVRSRMKGEFTMDAGVIRFSSLKFAIPGATADLDGVYTLDGQTFDFHGDVLTQAKLSRMVASKWKSLLLKAVDPFFKGKDGGAKIPVSIHGTKSEPKFGLDIGNSDKH